MCDYQLSEGCLQSIFEGDQVSDRIVQVLDIRLISNCSDFTRKRYKLVLSDGKNTTSSAVLTLQPSDVINVKRFSVIRIKIYTTVPMDSGNQEKTEMLILMAIDVISDGDNVRQQIGNPEPLNGPFTYKVTSSLAKRQKVENSVLCTEPSNGSFTPKLTPSLAKKENDPFSQFVYPIEALTPYFPRNNWRIKARVVNKSDMRFWSNAKGKGNFFTFDLMDASGEIRCTAFSDMAVKFYDFLEVDKVYLISNCELKPGNPRFNQLNNAYEMTTTKHTTIKECEDDAVPQIKFDFIRIEEIATMKMWSLVDIIGVCVRASQLSKTGKRQLLKREIILVDQSKASIEVTLWGSHAENFVNQGNPILAIKGAQVGEFAGCKNLSVLQNSHIKVNPSTPQSHLLRGWYDYEGKTAQFRNISERAPLVNNIPWATFKKIHENETEVKSYHQTLGTILWVQPNDFIYKGCLTEGCFKKVQHLDNAHYTCKKCEKTFDTFNYRLSLLVGVGDWQSVQEVTMFEDAAERILGKTSQEVGCWMEKHWEDEQSVQNLLQSCTFKQFLFKCKIKESQCFGLEAKESVVMSADPINYEEVNTHLVERINQLLGSK